MFYSMFMTWKLGTMLFFFTSVIFFFLFWNWVKKRLTGENICLCFFSARKFISPECYYRLVSYYNFVFCQLKRKKSFRKAILASSQARKWITRKIKHEEKSHIFLSDLDQILQKPWGTSEDFFVLLVIHFLQPVFFSSVFVKLRTGKKKKKKKKKRSKTHESPHKRNVLTLPLRASVESGPDQTEKYQIQFVFTKFFFHFFFSFFLTSVIFFLVFFSTGRKSHSFTHEKQFEFSFFLDKKKEKKEKPN